MVDVPTPAEPSHPEWFAAFLANRGTRKPSAHTMKAYRQDFDAIATFVAGADTSDLARMSLGDITTDSMRTAFAQHAETHEAATIQRCWSTWNVLCTFLYTSELIVANPMPLVGRPKLPKTLPRHYRQGQWPPCWGPSIQTRNRGDAATGSTATAP
jgi:integrase/recombinase XerC